MPGANVARPGAREKATDVPIAPAPGAKHSTTEEGEEGSGHHGNSFSKSESPVCYTEHVTGDSGTLPGQ
jgi:hypothetical protein